MKKWNEIKIPVRMENLPRDNRGYPIPFSIFRSNSGIPDFRMHDQLRADQCILNKRCSICGQSLDTDIWLIAGAKIALDPKGTYIDPPLHKECGTYALQICPYLALPSFSKRLPNEVSNSDPSAQIVSGKPTVFGFVRTKDYHIIFSPFGTSFIVPTRPLLNIEYWKNGNQLSPRQARMLFK